AAKKIAKKLPIYAAELSDKDETLQTLATAMRDPMFAELVAIDAAGDHAFETGNELAAALFGNLEQLLVDGPDGLEMNESEKKNVDDLLRFYQRGKKFQSQFLPPILKVADQLNTDDELGASFANMLRNPAIAFIFAAESEIQPGGTQTMLRNLLNEVLDDVDGKKRIMESRRDDIRKTVTGMLKACRQIRMHKTDLEPIIQGLKKNDPAVSNPALVYAMLNDVRRFVEEQQPDVFAILETELFQAGPSGLRIRDDRKEQLRTLLKMSKAIATQDDTDF
ncbi:MAG: hypothetical protein AAFP90_16940, partial [Planctomycetota bacterium]